MADSNDPVLKSIRETKAQYVRLGRSGLHVSVPILGAMSFGHKEWQPWVIEEEEALVILKTAFDRGVNTWDTANVYSNGISEEIIGKAIRKYGIPREKLVILTKCSSWVGDSPGSKAYMYREKCGQSKDYVNQGGLSRKAIFSAVQASLKRMDLDYIDILQIHRFDPNTPIEETMAALHDLVRAGTVRYIGASSMWTYQFASMQFCAQQHGWTQFISMQNQYNLLYREEEREMNRFCNETGVGLIPWSPLCRGHLARPPSSSPGSTRSSAEEKLKAFLKTGYAKSDHAIIKRVQELADKKGWTMSNIALAWINKRVSSPIVGCSSIERLDEALETRGKVLTDDEEKYLEEPYVPREVQGHV
ncbi:hypothetical protein LTR10_002876 [Elasticomyces elasticus]|nr:hypothetical protein LTR10_002876 [Elasticomyces elasticus]KAK4967784.1 hypothetical protein LTR42_010111 [Elasticomyces elasticus]